jgi:hypothetical protein
MLHKLTFATLMGCLAAASAGEPAVTTSITTEQNSRFPNVDVTVGYFTYSHGVVNDQLRIGLYGPMPMISYSPGEDWNFSLRGLPGGGVWNITDDNGDSKSIDLTSYQVGAYAARRLTGKLWLTAGAGFTVFNGIEYSDQNGDNETVDEDMESGFFG